MGAIKPEGYADAVELQQASAFIAVPDKVQKTDKERVLALCRQLADVLKPFALVDTTNERWRGEVLAMAEKVHDATVALHIDDPALGTLSEGIDGLEHYGSMVGSLEVHDQISNERMMEAPKMMDAMVQAIERCAASADVHPLDEWQLNKDADAVNDFGHSLMFKLIDHHFEDGECTRADQLLGQVAQVIGAAAAKEGLSSTLKERLTHFANNAQSRKERITASRAKA